MNDAKIAQKGFVQLNNPDTGIIFYRCPKGHVINYFANGDDYDCPVCLGYKPTIAGRLTDLNQKYKS